MNKRLVALIMLVVLAGFTSACRGADEAAKSQSSAGPKGQSDSSGATRGLAAPAPAGAPEIVTNGADATSDRAFATRQNKAAGVDPPIIGVPPLPESGVPGSTKVIKNINLQLRIEKGSFQQQFARASVLAEQFQGFVSGSQVSESENGELASGSLTIRVPSARFGEVVDRLKKLGKVTGEDRTGQDVSKEFVDLEARLIQAKTEEAFFLKLMGESKTVSDMIQVQSQLSGTQLRIEEIQGQLQYLKDQTSFSTITVNIYEPGAALVGGEPKPLAKAWEDAVRAFQSVISGGVVGLGFLAPFAVIGLLGLAAYRWSRRPRKVTAEGPKASS